MKKTNIIVRYDSEKIDVLNFHLNKKNGNIHTELEDAITNLYEKNVPKAMQEYLEDKALREQKNEKIKKGNVENGTN
ncbi:MAG: DUF6103 family protein [Clostridia bacterium]